jgi:hypothetical protein
MGNFWLLKRALPFVATFGLGLFVASFFVDLSSPRLEYRYERGHCRHELKDLRLENEQLRDENIRLRSGHNNDDSDFAPEFEDGYLDSQNVDEPVLPPPAVKSHKIHAR